MNKTPISKQLDIKVQRSAEKNELSGKMNEDLAKIGEEVGAKEYNGYKYVGSAAVHIYYNETFGHMGLCCQADGLIAHKCPELVAQAGMTDLMGTVMEKYGHRRPKNRNNF